jgi:hypothetical protein
MGHSLAEQQSPLSNLHCPPNGKILPVIQGSKGHEKAVFSTLVRIITGHAFIGSYTAKFHPDLPTSCPCRAPMQTAEHVIAACPLYDDARRVILQPVDRDLSLPILLSMAQRGKAVSLFIKSTRACMFPRQVWDPGQIPLPEQAPEYAN